METEKSTEELFQKTCRTCTCKEAEGEELFQSIFEFAEGNTDMRIVELLNSSTPQLTIYASDHLPKQICSQCVSKLVIVHQFQQMCIHSDLQLRSLLEYGTEDAKSTDLPEMHDTLRTPTEDPLQSVVVSNTTSLEFGGELKSCLKLELPEGEDVKTIDKDSCLEGEKTFVSKECKTELAINSVEFESDENTDYKTDENHEINNYEGKDNNSNKRCLKKRKAIGLIKENSEDLDDDSNIINLKINRNDILSCPECGKNFQRTYSLSRHMSVHNAIGKPYQCSKCKYHFTSEANLKRHEISHDHSNNPEGYKCIECPRRFTTRESLSAHQRSHQKMDTETTSKLYSCEICSKKFKKLSMLTRHSRNHQENKKFKCNLCDKTFAINSHLIDHLNKHNAVKPYICEYCNKAFQQSCTLKDHIRTHTGEQPFLCSECGKAFSSSSNMKQHLLRHTGEKRYECRECPKKFPCLSDLASHMAVHKKVKPHVCDICGSAFGKPYQLKKHKMYHNGEKPHKCEYCEMRFVCADHMRRHMRTHTGEKPYKCKYCERAFAQSNDLVKHLRSHVGDNVYTCELCPKSFRLATELREHFSQHKNDDEETRLENARALADETMQRSVGQRHIERANINTPLP